VHVTPSELRILQQDRIQIRFALLATMAYVIAELPDTGSRETPLEVPCTRPHWGFVLDGDVVFASDGMQQVIPPGSAFHIPPAHPPHTFKVEGRARIAGFEPIDPAVDTSDEALVSRGFQLTGSERTTPASVIPAAIATLLEAPLIEARQWPMSSFMLTQARFGPGSGYLEDWCDALGGRHDWSPCHRVGGRHRDRVRGRHLPLSGGAARTSTGGGGPRQHHRPDADRCAGQRHPARGLATGRRRAGDGA
jgi:hypothetical protein